MKMEGNRMLNQFETFIKDNFEKIPAVKDSRIREDMSTTFGRMLLNAESCTIDKALVELSRFSRQTRILQDHIINAYIKGLITNIEMMNTITKFEEFASEATPVYLTEILIEKCKCIQP